MGLSIWFQRFYFATGLAGLIVVTVLVLAYVAYLRYWLRSVRTSQPATRNHNHNQTTTKKG